MIKMNNVRPGLWKQIKRDNCLAQGPISMACWNSAQWCNFLLSAWILLLNVAVKRWSEHSLDQSTNQSIKAKQSHRRNSGTTVPKAKELARFKKKHQFLTPLQLFYPNLSSILTTTQQILEIKQLKSKILSTKSDRIPHEFEQDRTEFQLEILL